MKQLTIGMATYDDYDGVWSTIQAIRMYHYDVLDEVDFVVVDNNPTSKDGKDTEAYVKEFGTYVSFDREHGTSQARNEIFNVAQTEYVLCVDSHIMIVAGAIRWLLNMYNRHPNTQDLYHGPLLYDDMKIAATHLEDKWNAGMWGVWAIDEEKKDEAFEIPMHGMGLFSCRKDAWLGFNRAFRGFGGEEGYIHQKYRNHDRKVISLPFLQWCHRFRRTKPPGYKLEMVDRVRNYFIGLREVGLDLRLVVDHFKDKIEMNQMLDILVELNIEPEEIL